MKVLEKPAVSHAQALKGNGNGLSDKIPTGTTTQGLSFCMNRRNGIIAANEMLDHLFPNRTCEISSAMMNSMIFADRRSPSLANFQPSQIAA